MPHGFVSLSGVYTWNPAPSDSSSSSSYSSSSSSEDERSEDERDWPVATDGDGTVFTYIPRDDDNNAPPIRVESAKAKTKAEAEAKPQASYYSYGPGSAGRLISAAPPVVVYPPNIPAYHAEQAPVFTQCHHHASLPTPAIPIFAHCGHQAGHICSSCAPQKEKKKSASSPPKAHRNIIWMGSTKKEVDAQNAANHDAQRKVVPYEYTPDLQYWVRELDGTYTLRTHSDIGKNCLPGDWRQSDEGWWYWVRKEEAKKKKDTKKKTTIVQWRVDDWPRAFFA